MKLTTRYVLAGIAVTIGCAIWFYYSAFHILGLVIIVASSFFTQPGEDAQEISFRIPAWNARAFFAFMTIVLAVVLFATMSSRLPDGELDKLFGTWYFMGVLWLLSLSILTARYIEEKRKSQQNDGQPSSESALSENVSSHGS